jgi:hypothetical protein
VHNKERSPTLYCLVIQFESTTTRAFHACWELINSASEPQKRTKKGQLAINDDHRLLMDFVSSPRALLDTPAIWVNKITARPFWSRIGQQTKRRTYESAAA